jgi:hypothetical protein
VISENAAAIMTVDENLLCSFQILKGSTTDLKFPRWQNNMSGSKYFSYVLEAHLTFVDRESTGQASEDPFLHSSMIVDVALDVSIPHGSNRVYRFYINLRKELCKPNL